MIFYTQQRDRLSLLLNSAGKLTGREDVTADVVSYEKVLSWWVYIVALTERANGTRKEARARKGGEGGVERPCRFRHSRVLTQLASPATRNGPACWQAAEVVARENTLQRHPEMACRKMLVVFSGL